MPPPVVEEKKEDVIGAAIIQYNHYKKEFPIKNGELCSAAINEEYCLGYVFKGDFKLELKEKRTNEDGTTSMVAVKDNGKMVDETIFKDL